MSVSIKRVAFAHLQVEWMHRKSAQSMPAQHFHSHFELYLLCEGQRRYFISDRTYAIAAGAAVWIPPNCIHKTAGPDEPHARILLEIGPTALANARRLLPGLRLDDLMNPPATVIQLAREDMCRMQRALDDMLLEGAQKQMGGEQVAALRLAELLVLLLRGRRQASAHVAAESGGHHHKIYEVVEYIQSAYNEVRSLEEISGRFYISKYHLCRSFKRVTGLTIHEYITAARINQARQQLSEGTAPVTQIAHNVGYGSLSYFERVFKREVGISPGQFRSKMRKIASGGEG